MKIKFLSLLFLIMIGPVALAQKAEKATQAVTKAQDHEVLKGNYTSTENPDGILIYTEGKKLMAKIPKQASVALEHSVQNSYTSDIGIIFHFDPQHKQLIIEKDKKRQMLYKP